jgi:hypothetical protein
MMRGLMVKRGKLNPGSKLNKPYIENLMNKKFAAEPHEMKQEEMIEKMIPRDTVKRKTMAAFIQSKLKSNEEILTDATAYVRRIYGRQYEAHLQSEINKRIYERDAWAMYSVLFKVEQEEAAIDKEFVMSFVKWLRGVGEEGDHQKTPWYRTIVKHPAVDEFLGAWAKEKAEYLRQLDITKNMPCEFNRTYNHPICYLLHNHPSFSIFCCIGSRTIAFYLLFYPIRHLG